MRRPVSWLAGHSMMHAFPDHSSGCPFWGQCIALSTYSCRDSRGLGRLHARTTFPINPSPGTGAIMLQEGQSRPTPRAIRESGDAAKHSAA